MLKFYFPAQPSVIQEFKVFPKPTSSASSFGENTIEPNSAKGIFVFSSTNTSSKNTDSLMKLSLPLPKSSAIKKKNECISFGTQQGTLTDFSEKKSSDVLKEGKIYFTLGKMDKSTCSPKKEVKINKLNLSKVDMGKTNLINMHILSFADINMFINNPFSITRFEYNAETLCR